MQIQQVRAAVCHAFGEPLHVETVSLAPPKRDEVRVALEYCAICHSDIMSIDGRWGGSVPAVYGHEGVGRIEAAGSAVSSLAVGDRVVLSLIRFCGRCYYCEQGDFPFCETQMALDTESRLSMADGTPVVQGIKVGAFAEKVVVHESQCIPVDDDLGGDLACTLSCGVMTGFGAVTNTARMEAGATCVVVGVGGVGINCVQGAALAGASPVIAIDVHDEKLAMAHTFGATHTLSAGMGGEALADNVKALTGGRGADYVFVAVGHPPAIEQSVDLVRNGGNLVVAGIPGRTDTVTLVARVFGGRGVTIHGSKMGSARPHIDVPRMVSLHRQGHLKLAELVSNRYTLDDINQALDAVRDGRELKSVIVYDDAPGVRA